MFSYRWSWQGLQASYCYQHQNGSISFYNLLLPSIGYRCDIIQHNDILFTISLTISAVSVHCTRKHS